MIPENESWNIFAQLGELKIMFVRMACNNTYSTLTKTVEAAKEVARLIRKELMTGKKFITIFVNEEVTVESK